MPDAAVRYSSLATSALGNLHKASQDVVRVRVRGTRLLLDVTFFIIEVSRNGMSWEVERRFNDFVDLNVRLGALSLPLPAKGIIGFRKGSKFLKHRITGLNKYLERLVSDDIAKSAAQKFVDVFLGFSRHAFAPKTLSKRIHHSTEVNENAELEKTMSSGVSSVGDNEDSMFAATVNEVQLIIDDWAMCGR